MRNGSRTKGPKYLKDYFEINTEMLSGVDRISILLIGCGGNGSLMASRLARLQMVIMDMGHPGFDVTLVDGDNVELSNIGRQMFTMQDIGGNKAEVIASKINSAFGFDWSIERKMFDSSNHLGNRNCANLFITCVDNVETRKKVYKKFLQTTEYSYAGHIRSNSYYWMDIGNSKTYGQVILTDYKQRLQSIFDVFPDLEKDAKDKKTQGLGCSIFEGLNGQDLFVNDDVTVSAANMIWEMIKFKTLDYNAVFTNLETMDRTKSLLYQKKK